MGEKAQINLRVDPAQKARWQTHVDDSDQYVTLSGLIRASVEATLQDDVPTQSEPTPAVATDIQNLQDELADVRQNVAWLREQFQDDVDISGVAQDVFAALEPLPEPPQPVDVPDDVDMDYEEYQRHLQAAAVIDPDHAADAPESQTASDIAERVGTTPKRVEDAIEHLEDQFLPAVAIEYDGGAPLLHGGIAMDASLEDYFDVLKGQDKAEGTLQRYQGGLEAFSEWLDIEDRPPQSLSSRDLQRYLSWLKTRGMPRRQCGATSVRSVATTVTSRQQAISTRIRQRRSPSPITHHERR